MRLTFGVMAAVLTIPAYGQVRRVPELYLAPTVQWVHDGSREGHSSIVYRSKDGDNCSLTGKLDGKNLSLCEVCANQSGSHSIVIVHDDDLDGIADYAAVTQEGGKQEVTEDSDLLERVKAQCRYLSIAISVWGRRLLGPRNDGPQSTALLPAEKLNYK